MGRPFRRVEQCAPLDPCGLHTYFSLWFNFFIVQGPRRNNGQCDAGIARDVIIVVFHAPVHDASCARGRETCLAGDNAQQLVPSLARTATAGPAQLWRGQKGLRHGRPEEH
jgi:hypothetical protein